MSEQQTGPMRVAIVGGGTAGWMAAAALSKYFGDQLAITLIESDAIGTIGVGEATIPQLRLFNSGLGIDEREFLRETSATIKLGIQFNGWHREGHSYFHSFGDVGRKIGTLPFYQYWLRYHQEGGELDLAAFSAGTLAAEKGLYGPGKTGARMPASAYHFDATKYAAFLRRYAEKHGVQRSEGIVKSWDQDAANGHITRLVLDQNRKVETDLVLDCTGMRALLIGQALGVGYEDWTHWLPCDRAWAVPSKGNGRLDPFTRSTAQEAGWQWQIPLQHRTGNGHVFSQAHISGQQAADQLMANLPGAALADPRLIKFQTGRRDRFWDKNVVALGLSSGFLEPLESTSIHLIQSGIARLVSLFPDRNFAAPLQEEYNAQMAFEFASIRDFLILHYNATARDESEFWNYCRNMPLPDSLSQKLALFDATGQIVRHNTELFDIPSWLQVMWGQGRRPRHYHPMVGVVPAQDLDRFISLNAQETQAQIDALGPHKAYISRMCAHGKAA